MYVIGSNIASIAFKKIENIHNQNYYPANIYFFKVNKRNTSKRCEICPKLTIKTPERRLVSLLLTLNILHTFF